MKTLALAAVFAASAATASLAGNYDRVHVAEPVVKPAVVVEEAAASSNGGLLVPLFALIILAAALTH